MAITHNFSSDKDASLGGTWFDDYGRKIFEWGWDASSRAITVKCGPHGKKVDLSAISERLTSDDELRKRLPAVAIELAEKITSNKYDV